MASAIEWETIDGAYPVAGVDNDTQGFRDNFTIIKQGLQTAQSEISTLQDGTVKLQGTNNFLNNATLQAVNLSNVTEEVLNIGGFTTTNANNISFSNGHYQIAKINLPEGNNDEEVFITLTDWPTNDPANPKLARMEVHLYAEPLEPAEDRIIRFQVENAGTIKTDSAWPTDLKLNTSSNALDGTLDDDIGSPIIVQFWTYNGGGTVYARYLGAFS